MGAVLAVYDCVTHCCRTDDDEVEEGDYSLRFQSDVHCCSKEYIVYSRRKNSESPTSSIATPDIGPPTRMHVPHPNTARHYPRDYSVTLFPQLIQEAIV